MALLRVSKVVSSLPGSLDANTVYFVRVGAGFDLYVTNDTGTVVAYQINSPAGSGLSQQEVMARMSLKV